MLRRRRFHFHVAEVVLFRGTFSGTAALGKLQGVFENVLQREPLGTRTVIYKPENTCKDTRRVNVFCLKKELGNSTIGTPSKNWSTPPRMYGGVPSNISTLESTFFRIEIIISHLYIKCRPCQTDSSRGKVNYWNCLNITKSYVGYELQSFSPSPTKKKVRFRLLSKMRATPDYWLQASTQVGTISYLSNLDCSWTSSSFNFFISSRLWRVMYLLHSMYL